MLFVLKNDPLLQGFSGEEVRVCLEQSHASYKLRWVFCGCYRRRWAESIGFSCPLSPIWAIKRFGSFAKFELKFEIIIPGLGRFQVNIAKKGFLVGSNKAAFDQFQHGEKGDNHI